MMYAPRSSSVRSAHSRRRRALLGPKPTLDRSLSDERADAVRDVVSDDRAGGAGEHDEEEVEVTRSGEVPADDDEGLARNEREERVDDGNAEDHEVAPPLARDPLGEAVEVEPGGHGRILAAARDDDAPRAVPSTRRRARPRRHDLDRRAVLRGDPGRPRRGRRQGRASGHGRRRPRVGPAVLGRRERDVPLRQRRQAVARGVAAGRARARRRCCGSRRARTSSSRACGRASPSGSGSVSTLCGRGTRGWSTARSARTDGSVRSRRSPATTR